jgi:hypothetical protein
VFVPVDERSWLMDSERAKQLKKIIEIVPSRIVVNQKAKI